GAEAGHLDHDHQLAVALEDVRARAPLPGVGGIGAVELREPLEELVDLPLEQRQLGERGARGLSHHGHETRLSRSQTPEPGKEQATAYFSGAAGRSRVGGVSSLSSPTRRFSTISVRSSVAGPPAAKTSSSRRISASMAAAPCCRLRRDTT